MTDLGLALHDLFVLAVVIGSIGIWLRQPPRTIDVDAEYRRTFRARDI